ncbi:hypothetical protein C0995_014275 [Termitomyces sp. Mi166|nr:hypothetical protein C0995_014275 [Termitomyces sp. Mi166\
MPDEVRIPVIIVFTKYDLLYNEYHRKASKHLGKSSQRDVEAERDARNHLQQLQMRASHPNFSNYVTVSTHKRYPKCIDTLNTLTQTTRTCLHEVEGELWIPWAAAQRINAQQKVNVSIDEGFKKYWINLGKSAVFKGHVLLDCLTRIHLDMIEVWNFYDPETLLVGTWFREEMIKLIEPLLIEPEPGMNMGGTLASLSNLSTIAGTVAGPLAPVLSGAGIAIVAVNFLCEKYQAIPLTALCLGAYIVDLTLILHDLFIDALVREPPRPLNRELVADTLIKYKDTDLSNVHRLIRDLSSGTKDRKEKIAELIRQQLRMDRA